MCFGFTKSSWLVYKQVYKLAQVICEEIILQKLLSFQLSILEASESRRGSDFVLYFYGHTQVADIPLI